MTVDAISDVATLALVALVAVVPLACVVGIALLRGYTISLHMKRPQTIRRRRRVDDE